MVTAAVRPKGFWLLGVALRSRKAGAMLAFGFSSGLPFALLIGTLTAWLGEAHINLATIGLLSWIGLASAFKFLWSPAVDRLRLPGVGRLGRRKGWIVTCQAVIVAALLGLVATDPRVAIGQFALFAFLGALASATQDIAIDAWRIDAADAATPVEVLSAVYQLGFRTASIVGGAFALHLAVSMSWPAVYAVMAALMGAALLIGLAAPDTPTPPDAAAVEAGELDERTRGIALAVVGVCWGWAIVTLIGFMASVLATPPAGAKPPSTAEFLKFYGPLIVAATVLAPLGVAAVLNVLRARRAAPTARVVAAGGSHGGLRRAADHLYRALVAPLTELVGRLGWGVLFVIALILSYPFCYNVWASFAYPFYLDYMHYTKDEVAFASKVFGIIMSMTGIALGGTLFLKLGRFPTVLLGAALPIFGNFVYADLADGAVHIDAVLGALGLDRLAAWAGSDLRMARLLLTIAYENVSTGLAGAAFVAYVSSIVSKKFPAVQYALLSSLTFLIGSLGRGIAGEMIDRYSYAPVFRWTAAAGLVAIAFVLLEWWRAAWAAPTVEAGDTGERA
ncbi:AmpG family muropeptide MFS transporter [Sphingomonas sp.]|uniref:AmpG family muropeptide MFS transporter n=1 Tax=Sphingomonas sp. TaxID=28214 RepID=UPI003CC63DFF